MGREDRMVITKTEAVNKSKYAVSIDGEFAFVLYKGELHKYGIAENREISRDIYEDIMGTVLPKRAKLRCMNLLKSREYTRQQMEDKLRQGKYPPSVIEEALAYVESFGYIDDAAYARHYVSAYMERKSRRSMEDELRRKGVDRSLIEEAMRAVQEEDGLQDEEAMIKDLLRKKYYDAESTDLKEKRRIQAFLYRKGFSPDKIRRVMNCEEYGAENSWE